jgi:hypothetical protein
MYLLIFVAASLFGGWKAKSFFQALVISGAVAFINLLFALEKIEIYRRQADLGNSGIETVILVMFMMVITWVFFFVISLVPFALKKSAHRRRPVNEIGKV